MAAATANVDVGAESPVRHAGTRAGTCGLMLLAGLVLGVQPLAEAEVYRWVDEHGNTHYSDRSPAAPAESIDLPQGPGDADRREAEARARRLIELDQRKTEIRRRDKERTEREAAEASRAEAERRSRCARARHDLRALQQQVRVYWTNDRGERVYVEDADRAGQIRQLERFVAGNCPG